MKVINDVSHQRPSHSWSLRHYVECEATVSHVVRRAYGGREGSLTFNVSVLTIYWSLNKWHCSCQHTCLLSTHVYSPTCSIATATCPCPTRCPCSSLAPLQTPPAPACTSPRCSPPPPATPSRRLRVSTTMRSSWGRLHSEDAPQGGHR